MKVRLTVLDDDGGEEIGEWECDYVWLGCGSNSQSKLGYSFDRGNFQPSSVSWIVKMALSHMLRIDEKAVVDALGRLQNGKWPQLLDWPEESE